MTCKEICYLERLLIKIFVFCFWQEVEMDWGFPSGAVVNSLPDYAGGTRDSGSIPGLGRSPGEGNGNPLQYSCLESPMDRGAWWATVHGIAESQT